MTQQVKGKLTFKGSLMFPSDYVAAEDLKGDTPVTIAKVELTKLRNTSGQLEDKFLLHFNRARKPLVLNKTNGDTIASLHGSQAEAWTGKEITLYPTTCMAFGQEVTCIRVRPYLPDGTRPQPKPQERSRTSEMMETIEENQAIPASSGTPDASVSDEASTSAGGSRGPETPDPPAAPSGDDLFSDDEMETIGTYALDQH
jgi:hypothetical protein